MKMKLVFAVILMAAVMGMNGLAIAEDKKVLLNASDGIRDVLSANIGKRVSVKTDSGDAIEGIVVVVGNQLLHLEKITGKDFYDAVVSIDKISSITLRVRGN